MNDITLIQPRQKGCEPNRRLDAVLEHSLHSCETIYTASQLRPMRDRRLLFALDAGQDGVNIEYYSMLARIRADSHLFDGCVAGVISDGSSELYTKSLARELVLSANLAGCTFVGRPLVEATGSMENFNILANTLETDHIGAYESSVRTLISQLENFCCPQTKHPNILALHASNYDTSNTLNLWQMVKKRLDECEITEITLRNGEIHDCNGCPYTVCLHMGEKGRCFYGGAIVETVFPAIEACDALVLLCPNYNDAVSANIAAFINRLTSLYRQKRFYNKYLFALVVSGYSGGDLVAQQLVSGLNMNKSFLLPARFVLMETANAPGSILHSPGVVERADLFAQNMTSFLVHGKPLC